MTLAELRKGWVCRRIHSSHTVHVAVLVAETLGLAQTNSVNDTSVVQGVRDNGVLVREDGLKDSSVGVEA